MASICVISPRPRRSRTVANDDSPTPEPTHDSIAPMLVAAGGLPAGEGWAFEFEFDGYFTALGDVRALSLGSQSVIDRPGLRAVACRSSFGFPSWRGSPLACAVPGVAARDA